MYCVLVNRKNVISCIDKIPLFLKFYNFHIKIRFIHKACPPWKVAFYGSDSFSLETLKVLNGNRLGANKPHVVESLDVICPLGKNIINKYATEAKLNIKYWPYVLPEGVYHVGVVVSFGHLIQTKSINACTYLLPRWRGAAPIVHTILNGDEMTGITILQVSPNKFDRGKILLQEIFPVVPNSTSSSLHSELSRKAAEMVIQALCDLPDLLRDSKPQQENGNTHAFKIHDSMGNLNWDQMTCQDISRHYHALSDFIALVSKWKGNTIKFKEFVDVNLEQSIHQNVSPGFCYFDKNLKVLAIKCKDGWVGFKSIQLFGKKTMSASDFHNGFLSKIEEKYCKLVISIYYVINLSL
ncbi:methionyl-tRNA formyltransferase, mitochondrial-like isoform X2 [Centruroides sculpturatus]|uniref:methionyl-tRNA formyltransferase, mitochondrial-like isoform X2 n=1 Tax=Centruroides sculpturatus TaxID=218467 RepID=UPI000C6EA5D5|nr:methionyl-tRNA formyltransferase, mitochondrial-like isoform X2 [Centruroides sculpturatus]